MSVDRGFLDELERYLDDEAGDYTPAYVDRIIARTKHVRQRPGWSSLERWLPMDLTLRPAPFMVPRPSRILAVLALIVLIVALVAVAVGTRRPLPPPFGLARNGQVLVSIDGDILAVDPSTGRRSTMIGGPAFDFSPTYSRDGTLVLFLRGGPTDCGVPDCGLILTVANADGTNVRELTGHPGSRRASTGPPMAAVSPSWGPHRAERATSSTSSTSMARERSGPSTSGDP